MRSEKVEIASDGLGMGGRDYFQSMHHGRISPGCTLDGHAALPWPRVFEAKGYMGARYCVVMSASSSVVLTTTLSGDYPILIGALPRPT